jgi:DNA-binding transcriptional regulator YiaG
MTPVEFAAARKTLGLSVSRLARTLKSDERTIRRWEHGERPIPGPVEVLLGMLIAQKDCLRPA